ncbi:MAG TPA: hypothetical protein PKB02_10710 [Anaerohalosphaeraceae bacterium]|nr:hypothetical protein [Anaerohalosphaeraceae bacterium]
MPGQSLRNLGENPALDQIGNEGMPQGMEINRPAGRVNRINPCFDQIVPNHIRPADVGFYREYKDR